MLYTPVKQKFVTKQQANPVPQQFLPPPMAFISHFIYGAKSTKALQRHSKFSTLNQAASPGKMEPATVIVGEMVCDLP